MGAPGSGRDRLRLTHRDALVPPIRRAIPAGRVRDHRRADGGSHCGRLALDDRSSPCMLLRAGPASLGVTDLYFDEAALVRPMFPRSDAAAPAACWRCWQCNH